MSCDYEIYAPVAKFKMFVVKTNQNEFTCVSAGCK